MTIHSSVCFSTYAFPVIWVKMIWFFPPTIEFSYEDRELLKKILLVNCLEIDYHGEILWEFF